MFSAFFFTVLNFFKGSTLEKGKNGSKERKKKVIEKVRGREGKKRVSFKN